MPDPVGRMQSFFKEDEDAYVQMDTRDDIDEILSAGPGGAYSVQCFELMRGSGITRDYVSAIVLLPVQAGVFQRIGFSILKASVFDEDAVLTNIFVISWTAANYPKIPLFPAIERFAVVGIAAFTEISHTWIILRLSCATNHVPFQDSVW